MRYYKITGPHGEAIHGGSGKWTLPKGRKPGAWMPPISNISPCERGYHLVTEKQLLQWLSGGVVWEAEGRGASIECDDKSVWPEARLIRKVGTLTDKSLRLIAADFAEHVLPIFEKAYPKDDRPRKAIKAARDYANGKIGDDAWAAAWDAACDAAQAAARVAARDAAWAARDAACASARAAAYSAARNAAWAARAAARDAAWAALDDAWDAARAALDDAWDAARDAAWAAEREWQTGRLFRYLKKSMHEEVR